MKLNNDRLSLRQMRELVRDIIDEESKKDGVDVDVYPITVLEYYGSDIFKEEYKLCKNLKEKKAMIISDFKSDGFQKNNIICVFLRKHNFLYKILNIKWDLSTLVFNIYHEYRHIYQRQKFNCSSYRYFCLFLDTINMQLSPDKYEDYHNDFFQEVDADVFGIFKAQECLKQSPDLYNKYKKYIDRRIEQAEFEYVNYDVQDFFEVFNNNIQRNSEFYQCIYNRDDCFIKYFYNGDGSFKSMGEIFNCYKEVDSQILYTILSSKCFIDSIDYSKLDVDEANLILEALQYSYGVEEKKYNYNKNLSFRDYYCSFKLNRCKKRNRELLEFYNREIEKVLLFIIDVKKMKLVLV